MKKKIVSGLLMLVLVASFSASAMAATPRTTNYVDVRTSGGTNGYITVRLRCTCVQDSIPTNYSWSSSITPPTGITGLSYSQNGAVTKSNHNQDKYSVSKASYGKTYTDAIIGGKVTMKVGSTAFGSVSKTLSVTR